MLLKAQLLTVEVRQVLVETFEDGAHVTRYVEMGPGAPHNSALAQLGSGAMLQVGAPVACARLKSLQHIFAMLHSIYLACSTHEADARLALIVRTTDASLCQLLS